MGLMRLASIGASLCPEKVQKFGGTLRFLGWFKAAFFTILALQDLLSFLPSMLVVAQEWIEVSSYCQQLRTALENTHTANGGASNDGADDTIETIPRMKVWFEGPLL